MSDENGKLEPENLVPEPKKGEDGNDWVMFPALIDGLIAAGASGDHEIIEAAKAKALEQLAGIAKNLHIATMERDYLQTMFDQARHAGGGVCFIQRPAGGAYIFAMNYCGIVEDTAESDAYIAELQKGRAE